MRGRSAALAGLVGFCLDETVVPILPAVDDVDFMTARILEDQKVILDQIHLRGARIRTSRTESVRAEPSGRSSSTIICAMNEPQLCPSKTSGMPGFSLATIPLN